MAPIQNTFLPLIPTEHATAVIVSPTEADDAVIAAVTKLRRSSSSASETPNVAEEPTSPDSLKAVANDRVEGFKFLKLGN